MAADSGAVTHVIHPSQLPAGCVPTGATGDHFTGAGGEHIERFGEVDTVLTGSYGPAACAWDCADVTRALHSVAKVIGPEHGEGVREVLFTNRRAVVVPASFVEDILKRVTFVLEYNRVLEPVSCFGKAIKFLPGRVRKSRLSACGLSNCKYAHG